MCVFIAVAETFFHFFKRDFFARTGIEIDNDKAFFHTTLSIYYCFL